MPNVGCGLHVPPDLLRIVDAVQVDEQLDVVLVLAPGAEVVGDAGARKPPEDRRAVRLQPGVASHPERRARRKRQQVRQEVAHLVHQIDHDRPIGHADVHVQAEDQQRPRQLLQFLDDVVVADAGRDDLVFPARERMRAGGGHGEADALGGIRQLAAVAEDFLAQLATSAQIFVPTSTIDWCISRLIWSPSIGALDARSSDTCDRSSPLCGSTIWNSSSTPRVKRCTKVIILQSSVVSRRSSVSVDSLSRQSSPVGSPV